MGSSPNLETTGVTMKSALSFLVLLVVAFASAKFHKHGNAQHHAGGKPVALNPQNPLSHVDPFTTGRDFGRWDQVREGHPLHNLLENMGERYCRVLEGFSFGQQSEDLKVLDGRELTLEYDLVIEKCMHMSGLVNISFPEEARPTFEALLFIPIVATSKFSWTGG